MMGPDGGWEPRYSSGTFPPPGAVEVVDTSPLATQIAGRHYKDMAIQPVEFIHKNKLGFLEGCIIKRVCRWRNKDGIQDLRKAIHELELLIAMEEGK